VSSSFSVDPGMLLVGVLLLVGVIASSFTSRFRVPSLLLFLGLGMAVADDGLAWIRFDDAVLAQNIAIVALAVILFDGGLGTDPRAFRSVGVPSALLATVGVAITAGIVALAAWTLTGLDATTALLLGAVIASTDAAAVFAALRNEPLPPRIGQLLHLESGLNDPAAVLLTVGMVEVWRADPDGWDWAGYLGVQLVVGIVVGIVIGRVGRWVVDHVRGGAAASIGVVTLAIAAISYGGAAVLGGSGLLAVYLTGVVLTGSERASRSVLYFHEGLAATAQSVLFLLLGILVFPSELFGDLGLALVVVVVLILVARPIAVTAVLLWWRTPTRELAVVSWGGLRGAVPVVLATIPFTAGHPDGALIFDVAFVVVVVSVALQAPTIGMLARRLGVVAGDSVFVRREIVPVDALDADIVEITVPASTRLRRSTLRDDPPPNGARVAVIHRADDTTVIPTGSTSIEPGDVLLVVTPRTCELDDLEAWSHSFVPAPADPASDEV
jgi:cell volume regulation protein A